MSLQNSFHFEKGASGPGVGGVCLLLVSTFSGSVLSLGLGGESV